MTQDDTRDGHPTDGNRFAFLDGIRGIAALFVMTRHTRAYWPFEFYRSYLAVDLFFILSGFVIAHAYDWKIGTKRISIGGFAASRIIRLYPMFFLSVAISALVLFSQLLFFGAHPAASISNILLMILFTFAFVPSHFIAADYHMFPLNYPYWSLFFELVANAIYATIHRHLSTAVLVLIIAVSFAYTVRSSIKRGNLDTGFIWTLGSFATGTLRTTMGFFMGVLLYRLRATLSKYFIRRLSPWFGVLIAVAVLYSSSAEALNPAVDLFSVCVLFPIAVLIAANGRRSALEKILLLLGSASYPIYVLHQPVGAFIHNIFGERVELYAPWSGCILAAFLLMLSIQLEKLYDIPVRRWLSAWVRQRRTRQAAIIAAGAAASTRD